MFRLAKRIEKKWMMHYPFLSKKLCSKTHAANRFSSNKGNNKITEHRAIFQRESQNS